MAAAAADLSIFAHGEGTTVHVQGGSIEGGTQGVTVQAGARLEASGLDVTKVDVLGLQVQDKRSHLLLTACKVHDLLPCALEKDFTYGVLVQAGGSAQLKKCHISLCGHGAGAHHEGSRLEAEGCTFQRNVQCGVFPSYAAEVVVSGCHSTNNGAHGLWAQQMATLTTIQGCVRRNQGTDCGAHSGGRLEMQGVEVGGVMATRTLGTWLKLMRRLRGLIRIG